MKLCYRGVRYEKSLTHAVTPAPEIMGKYRGVPCKLHEVKPPLLQRLTEHLKLKYRGIDYQAV